VDPTLSHLQYPPPSSRTSSTQHHPSPSLSPFFSFPPITSCQVFPSSSNSSFLLPSSLPPCGFLSFSHGPSPSHHPLTSFHVSLFLSQSPPPVWSSLLLIHLSPAFHVTSTHPLFPIMHPNLHTGLHVLSIRPFN
jgi:hypothetical protein